MGAYKRPGFLSALSMAEFISYVKPRHFLAENGYKFFNLGTGFNLSEGDFVLDLNIGVWSSVFLNHYISSSGARGVGAFEVGFDQNMPLLKQGMLCSVSGKLSSDLVDHHPFDRDCAAIRIFESDEVSSGVGKELMALQTAYPYGYNPVAVKSLAEAKPFMVETAFQVAFKLPVGGLPQEWAEMIREKGYAWNWFNGSLVVANTKSASYGIPPNFRHLGLRRLELKFSSTKVSGATGPPTTAPKASVRPDPEYAGDKWRKVISAFRADPSMTTLTALTTDLVANAEFLKMGNRPEYNPGSRKKKWTTVLVDRFHGPEKAASFPELAKALDEIAGEGNLLTQFILIKKLVGQAKITVDQETIHYVK